MTAAVREAGGVMTEEDLAGYHGKIEEPASAPYRGYTVYKAGFWNQGPVAAADAAHSRRLRPERDGAGIRRRAAHDRRGDQARVCGSRSVLRRSRLRARAGRGAAVGAVCRAATRADRSEAREPRTAAGRSGDAGTALLELPPRRRKPRDAAAPRDETGDTTSLQVVDAAGQSVLRDAELGMAARRRVRRRRAPACR